MHRRRHPALPARDLLAPAVAPPPTPYFRHCVTSHRGGLLCRAARLTGSRHAYPGAPTVNLAPCESVSLLIKPQLGLMGHLVQLSMDYTIDHRTLSHGTLSHLSPHIWSTYKLHPIEQTSSVIDLSMTSMKSANDKHETPYAFLRIHSRYFDTPCQSAPRDHERVNPRRHRGSCSTAWFLRSIRSSRYVRRFRFPPKVTHLSL